MGWQPRDTSVRVPTAWILRLSLRSFLRMTAPSPPASHPERPEQSGQCEDLHHHHALGR